LYQPPRYKRIIEPFAGSARYALRYWRNDVLLVDSYPVIISIWKWLQKATSQDIERLPDMQQGQTTDDFNFDCQEAKWLTGFLVTGAANSPRKTVTERTATNVSVKNQKKSIASQLHKIRHWHIELGDYKDIPNQECTWYIDPPYYNGGEHYVKSNKGLDYSELGNWCKSRLGQTIVCENSSANWLPFRHLKTMRGSRKTTNEVVWTNMPDDQLGLL